MVNTMRDAGNEATIHCPPFKIFKTTIGTGPTNDRLSTDVLGIKCQTSKAALIREFLIQAADTMEAKGLGKFVPAGLSNVIGTETMKNIIRSNNQYLKNVSTIPVNGIPQKALYTEITIDEEEDDATKMTVYDYLMSAEWCHGMEPTDQIGRYYLITTRQQLNEARKWLDDNLEDMFTEHIPRYNTFDPIDGYPFPKRADKTQVNAKLGTYADLLRGKYTATPDETTNQKKWNKSPLPKNRSPIQKSFVFDEAGHPELTSTAPKRNQNGAPKAQNPVHPVTPPTPLAQPFNAQTLRAQIMEDMKKDLTKIFSDELNNLRNDMTTQITSVAQTIKTDVNSQIAEVLQTMQTLNQRFSEVMARLPSQTTTTPAHKKPKGLGVEN